MRIALAAALILAAAPAWAQTPVQRINIALERDGKLVSATTTLEDGKAELVADADGEYGLVLQSDLPVESLLSVVIGEDIEGAEEYSVALPAGEPSIDAALAFPALEGDRITLQLVTTEGPAPESRPAHNDGLPGLLDDPASE